MYNTTDTEVQSGELLCLLDIEDDHWELKISAKETSETWPDTKCNGLLSLSSWQFTIS